MEYTLDSSWDSVPLWHIEKLKKLPIRKIKKEFEKMTLAYRIQAERMLQKAGKIPATNLNKKEVKMTVDEAKSLINKIWLTNKNVKIKAYVTYFNEWEREERILCDYEMRNKMYAKKTAYIKTLIQGITQNNLEIDFWKNDGVVYFLVQGRQVSFHDPKNQIIAPKKHWGFSKNKNKRLPFPEVF